MAAILFLLGAFLLTVGFGFVYWPLGLIVAGLFALGGAALFDLAADSRRDRVDEL